MKRFYFLTLLVAIFLLSGCTNTFMGTVLVLSFRDIILYIAMAFSIALLISFKSSEKSKQAFWIWFILSLLLTPLAGFIYFLVLFSRK